VSTSVSPSLQRSFALFVTFALALGLLTPMLAPPRVGAATVPVINEFSASTDGTDVEYLELYADPGTDLSGYSVLHIEGDAGTTVGFVDTAISAAGTTDANGLLLISLGANTLENGSISLLLVSGFTGTAGTTDLDLDDDGTIDVAPWTALVDSIAVTDGGSTDATYGTTTLGPNYDGLGSFAPGGASRIPNGTDTDTAADWVRNDFDLAGISGFTGTPDIGEALNTPGAVNQVVTTEPPPTPEAVINEFSASTTGTDVEYVEVFGDPNTDLSSLTVVEIEGDAPAVGTVDEVIHVGTTDANGLWLRELPANALENGSLTLLLVRDFTGALNNDLDANDDGTFDTTPWAEVVDAVAINDGGATDRAYGLPVLGVSYDGVAFAPGGASRIPDGTDTNTSADWVRNDFDLAGIPGFTGTISEGEAYNTPGAANEVYVAPPPDIGACADPADLIHAVQGSGAQSPLAGTQAIVEGIVVGDFQYGSGTDTGDLGGFFLQEEDTQADVDPLTSEAIFVFDPNGTEVQVGDQVRVGGTVTEFGSSGSNMTELTNVIGLEVCASGATLPAATQVTLPVTAVPDFERYEGMLVTFPQALTISEYFNFDRYNEVVLSDGRQFQPTAVADPGSAEAAAIAAANRLGRITLDDGRTDQNPVPLRHPDGDPFTLEHRFRGGDTVQNVTGVIEDSHGLYRVQPTAGAEYIAQNPRPAAPADVGGRITAASFNVLNYFTTLDDGTHDICGPLQNQECRGADTADELSRQRAKIVAALATMDADVVGLMEIENNPGDVPTADLVAGLNDALGAGTYAYVETGAIGTDAIRVALIYKPASVSPVGEYAILDSNVDPRFDDDRSRPALAQTFVENATGAEFTMVVNHLKSKGSDCGGAPDDDPEQGNCNLTRTLAAQALVDWLATDPTGAGDVDALIMGDLNSYDHEDPITAIRAGADDTTGTGDDFTDLVRTYAGEEAYSYVYDGMLGYLDTALASPTIQSQVTGTTIWHINADEPDVLDYDTSFKPPAQDALYAPDPYRSSDHDPVIVGLDLLAYGFDGLRPPVKDSVLSDVRAGRALPLKFSLDGDLGLDIFFEPPQVFACDAWPLGASEDAVTTEPLQYDQEDDQYVFTWKTQREWAGTCRLIELTLDDGTLVTLQVSFAEGSTRPAAARR
jgi:predicted extracellular nuclease